MSAVTWIGPLLCLVSEPPLVHRGYIGGMRVVSVTGIRGPIALSAAIALLTILAGAAFIGVRGVRWLHSVQAVSRPAACSALVPLTTEQRPGPPWQRERHALAAVGVDDGLLGATVVENQRTGQAFAWPPVRTAAGAEFLVPTRYALVINRGWQHDPWVLCALAPLAPRGGAVPARSTHRALLPQLVGPFAGRASGGGR